MLANKEDWNKVVMAAKMVSDSHIQVLTAGVYKYIGPKNIDIPPLHR